MSRVTAYDDDIIPRQRERQVAERDMRARLRAIDTESSRIENSLVGTTEAISVLQDQIDAARYASTNSRLSQDKQNDSKMLLESHKKHMAELEKHVPKLKAYLKVLAAEKQTVKTQFTMEGNDWKRQLGGKPVAKKPPAKKLPAKKPTAKKPPAKKPPARKSAAKKPASKKKV